MDKKKYTRIEQNIRKHNTEQKYIVDIYLGRDENKKQQRTSKTCYSLADARKQLALAKVNRIKGTARTKGKTPHITELMENYRKVYIKTQTEETTSYGYSVIEKHIISFFETTKKNTRVDKITATTIDQYYQYLADIRNERLPNGMGANTVRKHSNFLSQLFTYAIKHSDVYGIHSNPVTNSTPPRREKAKTPDLSVYNVDKIKELLAALDKSGDLPLISAVLLALYAGTRRGETDYLKWSDVNLETGKISIKGSRTCSNKEVVKHTTKSGRDRVTFLYDSLKTTLKKYKEHQETNKSILGSEYSNNDYVLVRENGVPYSSKWVSRKFSEFLKKNNLPHIRYHDLRHLNASILLCSMPIADVSKHLGHTNTNTTTKIYAHSLGNNDNSVPTAIDKFFDHPNEQQKQAV